MFTILAGTRVFVKRKAETEWRNFVTTRDLTFDRRHGLDDNGGRWVFELDDWQLKVGPRLVIGRDKKRKTTKRTGTFNKCIHGKNGRGASRRRSLRFLRRR